MDLSVKLKIIFVALLIVFGVISRFLPHAFNFTPITAISLFVSAYFGLRYSLATSFGIMFVSDLFIGFYHWPMMMAVYGSFALSSVLGTFIKKHSIKTIVLSALGSSLALYLITDWAVWQFGTLHERSFSGLIRSYLVAIPFFRNSLAGDLFYTMAPFGVMHAISVLLEKRLFKGAGVFLIKQKVF